MRPRWVRNARTRRPGQPQCHRHHHALGDPAQPHQRTRLAQGGRPLYRIASRRHRLARVGPLRVGVAARIRPGAARSGKRRSGFVAMTKTAVFAAVATAVLLAGQIFAAGFPSAAEVGGQHLVLNGTATRTVWGFKVYEVGLFLDQPCSDAQAIMATNRAPKRIRMEMLRPVEKEKFLSTVQESIDRNVDAAEKQKFAPELESFLGYLRSGEDLSKGRVITVDFVPGEGMVLGLDDQRLGAIPGEDFYHVILRLWIGRPLQESIREGLLGHGAES
ncbi:MAG: hypothetical protein FGM15_05470 [Chthoniobacterales bacterium]|nr:hypothetical protein [Chthoniobacterales bacterium]